MSIMGKLVTFASKHAKGPGSGWMFGDAEQTRKGLIVIHEWWGMNEQIIKQGEEMAREGNIVTMVTDMYRGEVAIDQEHAGHLMHGLDWEGGLADIAGAAQYLKQQGCQKVGVTGFCIGGALSFAAAVTLGGDISAASPFYGIPRSTRYDLTQICIPVQAHFGEFDAIAGFSSKPDYDALSEKLLPTGLYEFHEYKAGHGFMNPTREGYDKDIAQLGFKRLIEFMHKNLA